MVKIFKNVQKILKSYEPFFGGHLMEWFSDRLSHDFGIEFLSISSLWIFVDTGLILGSNLFFPSKKISFENKFQNNHFKISNSRIEKKFKNRKFFDSKYFWSIRKKDCDTKSAAWFGLVTLSPETHGCPPCPGGTATASGYSVRIFGFGLPVLEIQEVILCVICVSFKNSLFFEANYRFDKHSGFHVCLAKTFSITLCWRTQVWFKRWAAQKTDWILISSILVFFRIHHGKSNKWSKFTV